MNNKLSKLEYLKEWKKKNPDKVKAHARKSAEKHRERVRTYKKSWTENNKDHVKQKQRDWYEKSKRRIKSLYLQREFGITIEEYEHMAQAQNGACLLCGDLPNVRDKSLAVDHCHKTKKIRGLLCRGCNVGIGNLKDDPILLDKAAAYIRKCM